MIEPGKRIGIRGDRKDLVKSYWFKTFSHPSFTEILNLFYKNNTKYIQPNLIKDNLTPRGLAYWVMGDGSLKKDNKTMILHTQSYSEFENSMLSEELNNKFNFNTKVTSHKDKYFLIKFNSQDSKQ